MTPLSLSLSFSLFLSLFNSLDVMEWSSSAHILLGVEVVVEAGHLKERERLNEEEARALGKTIKTISNPVTLPAVVFTFFS